MCFFSSVTYVDQAQLSRTRFVVSLLWHALCQNKRADLKNMWICISWKSPLSFNRSFEVNKLTVKREDYTTEELRQRHSVQDTLTLLQNGTSKEFFSYNVSLKINNLQSIQKLKQIELHADEEHWLKTKQNE